MSFAASIRWVAVLALGCGWPAAAVAETYFDAKVIAILDGDTIDVLVDRQPRRIRLSGIDAPERGQPWSSRAKQALAARVHGKDVRINAVTTDRYGRTVGEVYADGVCVGCELVREGHVWVYRAYTDDPVLLELEADARQHRRGLWSLPESERIPPWDWRRIRRGEPPGPDPSRESGKPAADFTCGTKHYCREMTSCKEAIFHLEECGLTRIDGDGDGVPCETLCRD